MTGEVVVAQAVVDIEDIRDVVELRRAQLEEVDELLGVLGRALEAEYPELTPVQTFGLAGLARAVSTGKAAGLLFRAGLDEEAFSLCRVLLEHTINVAWVLANDDLQDFRLALFEHNATAENVAMLEEMKTLPNSYFTAGHQAQLNEDRQRVDQMRAALAKYRGKPGVAVYGSKSKHPGAVKVWKDIHLDERAASLDLKFLYTVPYRIGSGSVHSSAVCMLRYVRREGDTTRVVSQSKFAELSDFYMFQDLLFGILVDLGSTVRVNVKLFEPEFEQNLEHFGKRRSAYLARYGQLQDHELADAQ